MISVCRTSRRAAKRLLAVEHEAVGGKGVFEAVLHHPRARFGAADFELTATHAPVAALHGPARAWPAWRSRSSHVGCCASNGRCLPRPRFGRNGLLAQQGNESMAHGFSPGARTLEILVRQHHGKRCTLPPPDDLRGACLGCNHLAKLLHQLVAFGRAEQEIDLLEADQLTNASAPEESSAPR